MSPLPFGWGGVSPLLLYGEIYDGVAQMVHDALAQVPAGRDVTLRIHSPGGSIYEALAIYSLLNEVRERLTAIVDGSAMSAAAVIFQAAKTRLVHETSTFMIHNAWMSAAGDADELEEAAVLLREENDRVANILSERSGIPLDEIKAMMDRETRLRGREIVEKGFADEVIKAASNLNRFDVRVAPAGVGEDCASAAARDRAEFVTPMQNTNDTHAVPAAAEQPEELTTLRNRVAEYEQLLKQQRRQLIKSELERKYGDVLSDDLDSWADLVMQDESVKHRLGTLAEKLRNQGEKPIRSSGVEVVGATIINEWRSKAPGAERIKFFHDNFTRLKPHLDPKGANTIGSDLLIGTVVVDEYLRITRTLLALNGAFFTQFDPAIRSRSNKVIPKPTTGSVTVVNATDYTGGDSTVQSVTVPVDLYTQMFHLQSMETMTSGVQLTALFEPNLQAMAEAISDSITALLTTTNFGTTLVVGNPGDGAGEFNHKTLRVIKADAKIKNIPLPVLAMDGAYIAWLQPQDLLGIDWTERGAFGFSRILPHNRWSNGVTNLVGIAFSPLAIACVSGDPLVGPGYETVARETLPNGSPVTARTWYDKDKRRWQVNVDMLWGCAVADANSLKLLVSA